MDRKAVQQRLGVSADGVWGRQTYRALLLVVAPTAPPAVLTSLANACVVHVPAYGADSSAARLADLLAQTANETGGYTRFEENLNYSAAGLLKTWPSRFTAASVAQYARKPEMIAGRVYGDRMGNLSPADGWAYRGRGMLQLTGRGNYELYDKRLGLGLDTNPELAAVPALSLLIALEFYTVNRVWAALDAGNTTEARRLTNGGVIGLTNVNFLRDRLLKVLA